MCLIYLNGRYYVEIKDERYKNHPDENNFLGSRNAPKPLRTQYQTQNSTQLRKNQKVIRNYINELDVENYPKRKQKPIIQQP